MRHPGDLAKAAYHLGNRHVPVQVGEGFLRIADDHVLEEMLKKLGAKVSHVEAPFEPEAGAYAGGHHQHDEMGHGGKIHDHHHDHDHDHDHDHVHDEHCGHAPPSPQMSLAKLLQLASPTLPVGAYSYSGGLEAAVEAGVVQRRRERGALDRRRAGVLDGAHGSADAVFLDFVFHRKDFSGIENKIENSSPAAKPPSCAPKRCRWAIR